MTSSYQSSSPEPASPVQSGEYRGHPVIAPSMSMNDVRRMLKDKLPQSGVTLQVVLKRQSFCHLEGKNRLNSILLHQPGMHFDKAPLFVHTVRKRYTMSQILQRTGQTVDMSRLAVKTAAGGEPE